MRPEELTIGDWVYYNGTPVWIDSISLYTEMALVWKETDCIAVPVKELRPIYLTDHILEINGATKKRYEGYSDTWLFMFAGCRLERLDDTDHWDLEEYENTVEVRYVHELQHLLKCFKKWNDVFRIK